MARSFSDLLTLLQLKAVGENLFLAESQDLGLPQVFGGQIMAQALLSAYQKAEVGRLACAFQINFLNPAKPDVLHYAVEMLHLGKSFSSYNVRVMQDESLIAQAVVSFQATEKGLEYELARAEAVNFEHLLSENEAMQQLRQHLPENYRDLLANDAFEVKVKHLNNPFKATLLPAHQTIWAKPQGELENNQALHQALLLYFSDFHPIATLLHPHQKGVFEQDMRIATLNHSVWFHRAINFNQGLLFDLNVDSTFGARGLASGKIYSEAGQLLASYQQQALIRSINKTA